MSEEHIGEISKYPSCGVDAIVEWRIDNFFYLSKKDGAYYYSPDISFGDQEWWLEIYPNGWSERDTSGHIDLCLWRRFLGPTIRQEFSLSFKTAKGEKYLEKQSTKVFEDGNRCHKFNRFIPRSELVSRRSELVPRGVLTLVCTMKNTTSAGSASKSLYDV